MINVMIAILKYFVHNILPFIWDGNISPIINQGIGPKPIENVIMNTHNDISGINPTINETSEYAFFK